MLDDVQYGWVRLAIGCQFGCQLHTGEEAKRAPLPVRVPGGGGLCALDQAGLDMAETFGSPKSV